MGEEPETYDLFDKEIFAAGTWRSSDGSIHEFSVNDLHEIVNNFNELKGQADPTAKLGHDDKQELLKTANLVSAGWPDNLKVVKDKIVADIKKIPRLIYKMIRNGGIKRISPEIKYNYQAIPNGKIYKNFLDAIAFIPATKQKAMKTLKDVVDVYYSEEDINNVTLELDFDSAVFTEGEVIDGENNNNNKQEVCLEMDAEKLLERKEAEITELKGKFSESESKVETLSNDLNEANEKIKTLETENKGLKEQNTSFAEEAKKKEIVDYVDSKIKEGKIPAALKEDYVTQFSELSEENLEGMKKIIDSTPKVDFSEHSIDTNDDNDVSDKKTNKFGEETENDDLDKKVKACMKEHGVDYITADEMLHEGD